MDANSMLSGRYLNAQDLAGRGAVRVTICKVEHVKFRDGSSKIVLSFEGARKQMALNKTNLRAVIAVTGTAETDDWVGQRITLEPKKVDFAGQLVDSVRVAAPAAPPPRPTPPPAPRAEAGDEFHATDEDIPF